jgi:hypothetical protein
LICGRSQMVFCNCREYGDCLAANAVNRPNRLRNTNARSTCFRRLSPAILACKCSFPCFARCWEYQSRCSNLTALQSARITLAVRPATLGSCPRDSFPLGCSLLRTYIARCWGARKAYHQVLSTSSTLARSLDTSVIESYLWES